MSAWEGSVPGSGEKRSGARRCENGRTAGPISNKSSIINARGFTTPEFGFPQDFVEPYPTRRSGRQPLQDRDIAVTKRWSNVDSIVMTEIDLDHLGVYRELTLFVDAWQKLGTLWTNTL